MFVKKIIILMIGVFLLTGCGMGLRSIPMHKLKDKYRNEKSCDIELYGNTIHYRSEGNPEGKVLLLLHGLVSGLQTWNGWIHELKDTYHLIRLDLPGFGLTGPSKIAYSKELWINTIHELTKQLSIETFSIAGNSLGGYIAWNYALKYPNQVERLILIDPVGYPQKMPFSIWFFSLPVIGESVNLSIPKFIFTHNVRQVYGDKNRITQKTIDFYYDMALRPGAAKAYITIFRILRSRCNDQTLGEKIPLIQCPTLLMWGDKDVWVPVELAYRWKKDLPDAQLILYPGVGHVPMEEIPQQSAHDAKQFIETDFITKTQNNNPLLTINFDK